MDRPLVRPANHVPLDAAMLVAQLDLQMEDMLPVALEAEVARLNDPRVHRPHRHLVRLRPFDAEVIRDAREDRRADGSTPGVMSRPIGMMEADRLEPGMPF